MCTAYGNAMTGQILPAPVAQPDMSYNLHLVGPALRWVPAEASIVDKVLEAYMDELTGTENQCHFLRMVINWATSKKVDLREPAKLVSLSR